MPVAEPDLRSLNPRYRAKTGIEPQIERPVLLRDQPLGRFAAVYLANVDRLDDSAIERLEQYVRGGGGLGIFVGEKTRADWVNDRLHRGGAGLMPAPLLRSVDLPVDRLNKAPDVEVTDHPVFFKFGNQRNSFLDTVLVQRYFALGAGWTPAGDESTRVIARLRNGSPLAVERSFGRGRVVAFLTKASSATTTIGRWNNWGDNPSYVVAIQQLQAYLAAGSYRDEDRRVATAIDVPVDPAVYAPRIAFTTPREAGSPLASVTVEARRSGEEPTSPVASLGRENMAETALAGVYLAHLARQDGAVDTRQFALNVDAQEGDLRTTPAAELATRLAGVPYRYYPAESLSADPRDQAGSNLSTWFLLIVVGLLAGEQLLAYSSSYHRASTGGDSA